MLVELKVVNFAIIDSVHMEFSQGLNILSGETGAGKSVLLKSLGLLMGQKSASDVVQNKKETATVEGLFDLSQRKDIAGRLTDRGILVEDEQLIVRRVIPRKGKSRVYLNGGLSSLTDLREVVAPLIEVTGHNAPLIEMTSQHENKNLQSLAYQLDLVDDYAGTWKLRDEVSSHYSRVHFLQSEIERINENQKGQQQRLDFLNFQRDEIRKLNLEPGEEDELQSQVKRMKNSQHLAEFSAKLERSLYVDDTSALSRLQSLLQEGEEIKKWDESLVHKLQPLNEALSLIEDVVFEFRTYSEKLGGNPSDLDKKEELLSRLRKLQRKYGASVAEILEQLTVIETEIDELTHTDDKIAELSRELDVAQKKLNKSANDLHKRRKNAANLLEAGVNDELSDLNMKGVHLHISAEMNSTPGPTGATELQFMIQSGKQDQARPLAKIASGGELSRILLSLKRVIGQSGLPRTYLFDEVDTGVSGPTAEKVGKKLKSIASGQQVLCVTHLPQVAAFAHEHFNISKSVENGRPIMTVEKLDTKSRVDEIAKLVSGEKISDTSRKHARSLIQAAR